MQNLGKTDTDDVGSPYMQIKKNAPFDQVLSLFFKLMYRIVSLVGRYSSGCRFAHCIVALSAITDKRSRIRDLFCSVTG